MTAARQKWFTLCAEDPAFFCLKLCHSAGNLSMRQKKGDPEETLILRNRAISIINERLNHNKISGATVATVASMVCYEASRSLIS